ncbi:MAG: hypothetical protein KC731_36830 [Myxococcales bacterium]|nr:hypothetical protein [Myxococcales bacterium]
MAREVTGRSEAGLRSLEGTPMAELWAEVGRRGRKSSTVALVAIREAFYGEHERFLMPGERGAIAVISKDLGGAQIILRFVEDYLSHLGLKGNRSRQGSMLVLELEHVRFNIALFPCTVAGPRGYPIPCAIADEIAHWGANEQAAHPDFEVLGALRPAMAQFESPRLLAISSPLAKNGIHYETVEEAWGNDEERRILAVRGPTWKWSPSITKEKTLELERDRRVWAREYAALPQSAASAAFTEEEILSTQKPAPKAEHYPPRWVALMDASSQRNDAWTLGFAGWLNWTGRKTLVTRELEDGSITTVTDEWGQELYVPAPARPLLQVTGVRGWEGAELQRTPTADIVANIAAECRTRGVRCIFADQHLAKSLQGQFSKHGVRLSVQTWSNTKKRDAVAMLRRLMRDGDLRIGAHPKLLDQLRSFEEKITPAGNFQYSGRGRSHDDYVALLLNLAMALLDWSVPGAPDRQSMTATPWLPVHVT